MSASPPQNGETLEQIALRLLTELSQVLEFHDNRDYIRWRDHNLRQIANATRYDAMETIRRATTLIQDRDPGDEA